MTRRNIAGESRVALKSAVAEGASRLKEAGIGSPQLDAELLLAKVLNKDRHFLYMNPHCFLDKRMMAEYCLLLERRAEGEPLQYLTGSQEFMGLKFSVNPSVLIPRPDTETLVEAVLNRLKGRVNGIRSKKDVHRSGKRGNGAVPSGFEAPRYTDTVKGLDIGTGSGAIAVSLAYYFPSLHIKAVDISGEALDTARINAVHHGVVNRIEFIKGNLFSPFRGTKSAEYGKCTGYTKYADCEEFSEECSSHADSKFDFIVSNPPYISEEEMKILQREVRREPVNALYGGRDGLYYYREIATAAPGFLKTGGFLALEIGYDGADAVTDILAKTDAYGKPEVFRDLAGIDRAILVEMIHDIPG